MSVFEQYDFDPLSTDIPTSPDFPLKQLKSVIWSARRHLRGMDRDDVLLLERYVEKSVDETRAEYVKGELDDYVAQLLEHGGWELGYLPHPEEASEADIRYLLTHWSAEWDDPINVASEQDLSRVEALEMAVMAGLPSIPPIEKFTETRSAAVLALMLVAEAIDQLRWHKEGPADLRADLKWVGLCAAADTAIEAALALGLAERLHNELNVRAELSKEQSEELKRQRLQIGRERARHSAKQRHEPSRQAMQYVQAEWNAHAHEYDHNKSEFARIYEKLVAQNFTTAKGDPLKVKDRTIREVWLRDCPSASKPAKKPADRE
jgi:hypothetical protein